MKKKITDQEKITYFLSFNEDFEAYKKYTLGRGLIFTFDKFGTLVRVRKITTKILAELRRKDVRKGQKYSKNPLDKGEEV